MAGIQWSEGASAEAPPDADQGSLTIEQSASKQYGGVVFGFAGGIIFLFGGVVLGSQAPIFLIGFWFFGILMILGGIVYARRGTDRRLIEVGPEGIWLPEMGLLAWTEIREVRLEAIRAVGEGERVVVRRRLGVEPADPDLRPSAAMRVGWGLFDGFGRFLKSMAPPGLRFASEDRAPFGLGEPEASPAQVDAALAVVSRYVEVVDADEERARRNAPRWAARAEAPADTLPAGLAALDARLGQAGQSAATPSFVPIASERPPAATFRYPALTARVVWGYVAALVPVGFIAIMVLGLLGQLHAFGIVVLLVIGALVGVPMVLRLGRERVAALRRSLMSDKDRTVLRVRPDGLWLPGMGTVGWPAVRAVRTRVRGTTRVGLTGEIPRWGLFVEAEPPGGGPAGEWAVYADELGASFDDVVDLVRYYHRVEEAPAAPPVTDQSRTGSRGAAALFGPAMLVMAMVFIGLTLVAWSNTAALADRGVTASGAVIAKRVISGDGHDYQLQYEFRSADGVRQSNYGSVSAERFGATAVGDPVTVTYLADDPGVNALGRPSAPPAFMLLAILAFEVVFVVLGGAMTLGTIRDWRRRRS